MPQHSKFENAGLRYAQLRKKKAVVPPADLAEARLHLGNRDRSKVTEDERKVILDGIAAQNKNGFKKGEYY